MATTFFYCIFYYHTFYYYWSPVSVTESTCHYFVLHCLMLTV
ncbi:protein of unknown function [Xenorhabdus poinarii G6]|uniref:Uncharacterized protein n=1 Tax=Xenorhabdus poinarii G6 TaxID=1354304 RepID=A0A068R4P5_9GAMM|nr:protein of unknown function [Xenorhabdus poinarii G6]